MTLSVISTPLDPGQNSYVSLSEMTAYLTDRVFDPTILTTWTALTASQQAAAVVNASRSLDTSAKWIGDQYSRDQKLKWPRTNAWVEGFLIDVVSTPELVKEATCEMAIWIVQNAGAVSVQNQEAFDRIWIGPLKLNMNDADGQPAYQYFPDTVAMILSDLAVMQAPDVPGGNSMRVVHLSRA